MKVEQLVEFLLDKGYSAKDTVPPFLNDVGARRQPRDSVLGLAVSRAGTALVQRLISQGADVYLKQHFHDTTTALVQFGEGMEQVHDVTTLHMASLFWNANVVKLLLEYDYYHRNKTSPDLVSSRDMNGRLSLHWAAAGPGLEECKLLDKDLSVKITETFRLLISSNPASINLPDDTGSTPLHYAVQAHATCGGSKHAKSAIQCLLEHGADPKLPDGRGQSVLHMLVPRSLQGGPIQTTLLELLMAHGVNVNQADKNGNTALHVMVQNLRQTAVVKCLLDHGAHIQLTNTIGETAFHAAARGYLLDQTRCNEAYKRATVKDAVQAQDCMMRILQAAAGENTNTIMSQQNKDGKTPRELLEETRSQRHEIEQQMRGGQPIEGR
ncbi:ankyrin repeat-containing domain protein [Aspergillus similis]